MSCCLTEILFSNAYSTHFLRSQVSAGLFAKGWQNENKEVSSKVRLMAMRVMGAKIGFEGLEV
jgi:hypothetical protein